MVEERVVSSLSLTVFLQVQNAAITAVIRQPWK